MAAAAGMVGCASGQGGARASWLVLVRLAVLALVETGEAGEAEPPTAQKPNSGLDLRVTRGLGPKGYGKMRVSAITHGPATFADFNFTYSEKFRFRWTAWPDAKRHESQPYVPDRWLHSVLLDVPDGGSRDITIGGQSVTLRLPAAGGAVRGLFLADPCFMPPDGTQHWMYCAWSKLWGTFNKTKTLLNSALAGNALDFWMILGDNFYDQNGALSDLLFSELSLDVKSKPLGMVVGNHDMWVGGGPGGGDEFDQHGIGMMQYYALDPASSLQNDVQFLDFSIDPDKIRQWNTSMNTASNLVWYNMLGNVAFLGLSGAFPESELGPHLDSACRWLGSVTPRPQWVFLLGHWNEEENNTACDPCPNMATPSVRKRLLSTPGCREFGTRLKYHDGHVHCNQIQERDEGTGEPVGFMIGGAGMSGCHQYGFEYLDSSEKHLRIVYFELESADGTSRSDEVLACIKERGVPACTHLGTIWLDVSDAGDAITI